MRTRYALVGLGGRGYGMFAAPLVRDFADVAELVALCDSNPRRLALALDRLSTWIIPPRTLPRTYTDLSALLAAERPDVLIVATIDRTHAGYILQGLQAGCNVITEKPMCTTAEDVRGILAAESASGHRVTVTLNARYMASSEALARLLRAGTIGDVTSVEFVEYLDTAHGADYFRRWHRRKQNSGGLLIHKASHHFDQLNWWIGSEPETVFALGDLRFYGPTTSRRGERCRTCVYTAGCPFHLDLAADPDLAALYLQAEEADGYYRDRCVYADEIDIEDTLALVIRYRNRVLVNYSLNAFMPYEGQRIGFNGTRGRLEIDLVDRYHGLDDGGHLRILPLPNPPVVRVSPLFGRSYTVPVEERAGEHGGADARLRERLFRPGQPDPLGQTADSRAGALSVLVGAAANLSIASGQPRSIAELLSPPEANTHS